MINNEAMERINALLKQSQAVHNELEDLLLEVTDDRIGLCDWGTQLYARRDTTGKQLVSVAELMDLFGKERVSYGGARGGYSARYVDFGDYSLCILINGTTSDDEGGADDDVSVDEEA